MIMGIISDTHSDPTRAALVVREHFDLLGVGLIIHCGDISPEHAFWPEYQNIPVIVAMTERKPTHPNFINPPKNWLLTYPCLPPEDPTNRIIDLEKYQYKNGEIVFIRMNFFHKISDKIITLLYWLKMSKKQIKEINKIGIGKIYVGHSRSFDFLFFSLRKLKEILDRIWNKHHGVNLLTSGHVHHQTYEQGKRIKYINPGAMVHSVDGHEFVVYNSETDEVVFSRYFPIEIKEKKTLLSEINIAVIADSREISKEHRYGQFWSKLADILKQQEVEIIIHCGGIDLKDIGRPELADFKVYVKILPTQNIKQINFPKNWILLTEDEPIVHINGYQLLIDYYLGKGMLDKSEEDLINLELDRRKQYDNLNYVLFGFTNNAFYEEGDNIRYVNPGDVQIDRNYVIIELPRNKILFGHVPI